MTPQKKKTQTKWKTHEFKLATQTSQHMQIGGVKLTKEYSHMMEYY